MMAMMMPSWIECGVASQVRRRWSLLSFSWKAKSSACPRIPRSCTAALAPAWSPLSYKSNCKCLGLNHTKWQMFIWLISGHQNRDYITGDKEGLPCQLQTKTNTFTMCQARESYHIPRQLTDRKKTLSRSSQVSHQRSTLQTKHCVLSEDVLACCQLWIRPV